MAHIFGFERSQLLLLPETVDDYVGADNPVRFIDAFVDQLDLAAAGFSHVEPEATGRPGYAPGDMLKLYIYGYLNLVRSSRRLEAECHRNSAIFSIRLRRGEMTSRTAVLELWTPCPMVFCGWGRNTRRLHDGGDRCPLGLSEQGKDGLLLGPAAGRTRRNGPRICRSVRAALGARKLGLCGDFAVRHLRILFGCNGTRRRHHRSPQ
jgi:hypothetical protein